MVTAEFGSLAKAGGLADMARAIAASLSTAGMAPRVLLPGYRSVVSQLGVPAQVRGMHRLAGYPADLLVYGFEGTEFVIVHCPELYDRPGGPYLDESGREWHDVGARFGALCQAAALIVNGHAGIEPPDLLHLNDWHAALTPALVETGRRVPTILTVHNFMFQGRVSLDLLDALEPPDRARLETPGGFFGGLGFLQVGLRLADSIVTVSHGYARELRRRDRFNHWYVADDRDIDRIEAIENWPDLDRWNPSSPFGVAVPYDAGTLDRRLLNRRALEDRLGWASREGPIFCTLSRITRPKGFKFLIRHLRELLARECRIVFVGEGERRLVNGLRDAATRDPTRVALLTPYDEADARRVLAGADALLMPSLTEPCGLSQQYAQRFGCVPVVTNVGGLPDTVRDGETGFVFAPSDPASFSDVIARVVSLLPTAEWRELQRRCMTRAAGGAAGEGYVRLIRSLLRQGPEAAASTRRIADSECDLLAVPF